MEKPLVRKKTAKIKSYRMVYHRITQKVSFIPLGSIWPVTSVSMKKVRQHSVDFKSLAQKLNLSGSPDDLSSLYVSLRVLQIMVAKL